MDGEQDGKERKSQKRQIQCQTLHTIQPTASSLLGVFTLQISRHTRHNPDMDPFLVCMGPLSSFSTGMSISAWRWVILSTAVTEG